METKKTYTLNSGSISDAFQKIIDWFQENKVSVTSKTGKEYIKLPFIIAFIVAILVPFALVIGIILALAFDINITFERISKKEKSVHDHKRC
ncbi:hypothetical protein [Sphingobacterium gobiense]|uniref:DUF4342 domain-containing protein n=1 Tax=Sphingobacterium gobiense TaxID=1382456 RepID=A0A2S9JVD4_9SPHI|nr:hypothetical protein [Sphingobacterium gobiense]PRD57200.1 hypothetical protein C5749_08365 [Sphingobacterium gobiense]